MRILSVIPLKKGVLKGNLTYFTSLPIPEGNIVSVPIRNKKVLGLVIASEELSDAKGSVKGMDFNLRKISEDKGSSIFRKEFMDAAFDTCKYFAQNKNSAAALIPGIFMEEYDKISKIKGLAYMPVLASGKIASRNLQAEKLLFQSPLEDRISAYKTLIRESFSKGKSVFIVLGAESGIELFASRLSKGIEQFSFSLHSGQSDKKNLATFEKIMSSGHPLLMIGTAPFLSIPRTDIGTIILEEESGAGYRMIARPHFDLRVFVEIFASKINAKFLMAGNLLRFETLDRKDTEGLSSFHPLSFRTDFKGEIEVVGQKPEKDKEAGKKFKVIKDEVLEEITSAIQNKKNVFIFSLRKGLATLTVCRDCASTVHCDVCSSPLVLYVSRDEKKKMFACNKCGSEKDPHTTCGTCGSWNLMPLGIGTDTVYEYLKENPDMHGVKIFKLDKESAKSKSDARKIAEDFEKSKGAILVGTEMATHYFKEKTPLSVIASFDSLWSIPNFRMGEKILKILLSIIDNTKNKLIIQAKHQEDGAIMSVVRENFLPFVREELAARKILSYPPYKRFIKLNFLADKEETLKTRAALKEVFKDYDPDIFSSFVPRLKSQYSTNILIKLDTKDWSLPSLIMGGKIDEQLHQKLLSLPPNFQVFIDPEDLL